ncbi:hypothetical protein V2H45_19620 [Tumidithrix elongata RA019]|uniref:Response regulatory domain-containing protein n=1 Tax=Tumidithrix elongata BACA0141 TaxID=2716417 RepID=A0AAW9Q6V7_9CYAN|nr:hypothetical protein [Tumidithrix elongata RA019]
MAELKRTVLMTHLDQDQGKIWQISLTHQGVDVIWDMANVDLVERLEQLLRSNNLPDLLLMDTGIKNPNAESLQSGSVCQWITKKKVALQVILFNPRQDRIKDIEHSWALRRGAVDVLPRLTGENLVLLTARVTGLLGCTFIQEPIERLANQMVLQDVASSPTVANAPNASKAVVDGSQSSKKQTPDPDDSAIMYRGVRIRR